MNASPAQRGDGGGRKAPGSLETDRVVQEAIDAWRMPGEPDDGPETPAGPRLTFADEVEREASKYRARGSVVGDFLGREMERIATTIRWVAATTPEQYEERLEVMEEDNRRALEAAAFEDGQRNCHCGECPVD